MSRVETFLSVSPLCRRCPSGMGVVTRTYLEEGKGLRGSKSVQSNSVGRSLEGRSRHVDDDRRFPTHTSTRSTSNLEEVLRFTNLPK